MRPTVFPEVLKDGHGYTIYPIPGYTASTDLVNRIINVPVHDTPFEAFIRLHELAHIKWTPPIDPKTLGQSEKIDPSSIQAAEDARMALGLIRQGAVAPDYNTFREPEFVAMMAHIEKFWADDAVPLKDRVRSMAHATASLCPLLGVARMTIGIAERALGRLPPEHRKTIKAYLSEIADTASTIFRNIKEEGPGGTVVRRPFPMSAYVWELSRAGSYPHTAMPEFALTVEFARWLDRVFPPEGRAEAEESPEMKALRKLLDENKKLPPMKSIPVPTQLAPPATGNQWGKLFLEVAPMERNARTSRILSQKVPSDMGTRMRDISRIFSDSKLFERRKKVLGGTVLIDASGSMSLSASDVSRIIELAPAATVAIYDGTTGGRSTRCGTRLPPESGVIRILAQRGYICRDPDYYRHPSGGCNIVDGPALEWMAAQTAPRLWISDGGVTGLGDHHDSKLSAEANRLCVLHDISRIPDGDDVISAFRDLKRGIPVPHHPIVRD